MADQENRTHSDKFMLRLPDGMRERIKAAAEANNRSMNSEILARVEQSFSEDWDSLPDPLFERLQSFERSMIDRFNEMKHSMEQAQLERAKAEDALFRERLNSLEK